MCFDEEKKFGNDFKQLCIGNKKISEKDNWCLEFLLSSKLQRILRTGIAVCLKFATLSIIPV